MSMRRKILLLIVVAAAAFVARRKLVRLVTTGGDLINNLFQTELDTYTPEDLTWSIFTREHAAEPHRDYQDERSERLIENRGYPIYLGTIWNWMRRNAARRDARRNGDEADVFHRQTAS